MPSRKVASEEDDYLVEQTANLLYALGQQILQYQNFAKLTADKKKAYDYAKKMYQTNDVSLLRQLVNFLDSTVTTLERLEVLYKKNLQVGPGQDMNQTMFASSELDTDDPLVAYTYIVSVDNVSEKRRISQVYVTFVDTWGDSDVAINVLSDFVAEDWADMEKYFDGPDKEYKEVVGVDRLSDLFGLEEKDIDNILRQLEYTDVAVLGQ